MDGHKGNCNYLYHTVSFKQSHLWAWILFLCLLRISPSSIKELAPEFDWKAVLIEWNISVLGLWVFPLKNLLATCYFLYPCSVAVCCEFQGQAISLWAFIPLFGQKSHKNECASTFLIFLTFEGVGIWLNPDKLCGISCLLLHSILWIFLRSVLRLKPNNHEITQKINSGFTCISPHS